MSLVLYNTLTGRKDTFEPIEQGKVRLYTCGPTVYNYAHIGNLRTYVFEDILKRALAHFGYDVRHVMNVTDVGHLVSDADEGEDKIALAARREGKGPREIAEFYWQAFRRDLERLNIVEPDVWCKATDHIAEQIDLVRKLEEKGLTYIIDDGVYFDTSKLPDYGKLARLDIEGLQPGARVEMVPGKRNPTDFGLWKFSPKNQQRLMEWQSPWGVGFPGWHIECSAMAIKYLGERLDVHCGGVDHLNVHHTNEIAQAESALGHQWVNWWMHGEFLTFPTSEAAEEEKMSKSSGQFLTLDVLVERGFDPLAYRYFLLNAHYRQQLAFTWKGMQAGSNGFGELKSRLWNWGLHEIDAGTPIERQIKEFQSAVEDDLNMPRALAAMWATLKLKDSSASEADKLATLLQMDTVLGLGMNTVLAEAASADLATTVAALITRLQAEDSKHAYGFEVLGRPGKLFSEKMEWVIEARRILRSRKNFAQADRVRADLATFGLILEDAPEGTTWRGSPPPATDDST